MDMDDTLINWGRPYRRNQQGGKSTPIRHEQQSYDEPGVRSSHGSGAKTKGCK